METFFISDTHFDHSNVLLYNNRPWLQDGDINPKTDQWVSEKIKRQRTDEMNEGLIERWNSVVGRKDRVIIVGDFAFKRHAYFANALKGKKILIIGSHDKANKCVYNNCFMEVTDRKTMIIKPDFFDISHCCQRVWERSHYGGIHIFGHSHGRLRTWNLSFDVGVDAPGNHYTPVHIDEIRRRVGVRTEEMRDSGRVTIERHQKNGKIKEVEMFYQDDLAFFKKDARIKPRGDI